MSKAILLGRQHFAPHANVFWNPAESISGHALLVGSSGTGKTYRLRYLIDQLVRTNPTVTIHILDSQNDIETENANRTRFSETEPFGLNPLEVHQDADFGGIRRRINSFIWMINTYSTKLGINQESTLRALLEELYFLNGYDPKDPKTWNPRTNPHVRGRSLQTGRHPTVQDLNTLCQHRLKQVLTGARGEALRALDELSKAVAANRKALIKQQSNSSFDPEPLRQKAKNAYERFIDNLESGTEVADAMRYGDYSTMKSVLERIKALESSGIFKDAPPQFDPGNPLRIYDISSLAEAEMQMFADTILERLFLIAKSRGIVSGPDTFIVIDEAHKFMRPEADHILNRMSREARKFGVGLILVSQSFDHFPEDLIANSALTMILGLHDMHTERTERRLSLPRQKLKFINPQHTALVQIRTRQPVKGAGRFQDIELARV